MFNRRETNRKHNVSKWTVPGVSLSMTPLFGVITPVLKGHGETPGRRTMKHNLSRYIILLEEDVGYDQAPVNHPVPEILQAFRRRMWF